MSNQPEVVRDTRIYDSPAAFPPPAAYGVGPARTRDGIEYWSDGAVWRPAADEFILAKAWGSVAAPLATLTGTDSAMFVLPGGNPQLPAGLLRVGSQLAVTAVFQRLGTTGVSSLGIRLATLGGGPQAGAGLMAITVAATNLITLRTEALAVITGATTLVTPSWTAPNSTTGVNAVVDRSGSSDITQAQELKFVVYSANAADTFTLIGYTARIIL